MYVVAIRTLLDLTKINQLATMAAEAAANLPEQVTKKEKGNKENDVTT